MKENNLKSYTIKWEYIFLFILIIPIGMMFSTTYNESKMIMLSSDFALPEVYKQLGDTLPEGRILMEDTLAISGSHITSMMSILSKREIISFGPIVFPKFNLLDNTGPSLFNTNVEDWKQEELIKVLSRYNIKWALIYSPNYFNLFNNTMKMQYQVVGPFVLFDTGINSSYIVGNISDVKYDGTTASAQVLDEGEVMLSVNFYPNWKASFMGYPLETYSCNGMVCVNFLPNSGVSTEFYGGELKFEYKSLWYEWVGYIITALTMLIIIWGIVRWKS